MVRFWNRIFEAGTGAPVGPGGISDPENVEMVGIVDRYRARSRRLDVEEFEILLVVE